MKSNSLKKFAIVLLCFIIASTGVGCGKTIRKTTKNSQSSVASVVSEDTSKKEYEEKKQKYAEMVQVEDGTCKRNAEGIPEIYVTYNFYNNTDEEVSFAGKFHDVVKHEFKECYCISADENAEKVLKPGERVKTTFVYEGNGTITGFLEIRLLSLSGNEEYLWKCFELK